jgi:hypothetical protein
MRMLVNYFIKVVHFMHFLDHCSQFIAFTKCTVSNIYVHIKDVSLTCIATSVPSSGSGKCQI